MRPRRLDWAGEALTDLADVAAYSPAATWRALVEIEEMAARGFNYGVRLTGDRWCWPVPPLTVYYHDTGTTLVVVRVLDGRRVRQLPERH